MKTIQPLSSVYRLLLIGVLAPIFMVSVLLHAAVPGFSGRVTATDHISQRVIDIDGNRYTIANDATVSSEDDADISAITLDKLKKGQAVYFIVDGRGVIIKIHIFEE